MDHLEEQEGLIYAAPPSISKEFQKEFDQLVPKTLSGQPMLQYVWGCDRSEYVAGHWVRRYSDLDNEPAKYVGRCCWILEGYQPPTIFDEAEWEKDKHLLGDFPREGVYDFIEYHVDADDNFLPLDSSAIRRIEQWRHWQDKGVKRSIEEIMEKKLQRWQLQRMAEQSRADAVAQRFGEQVVQCFEQAKDTPDAYSLPSNFTRSDAGIIIPKGLAANTKGA